MNTYLARLAALALLMTALGCTESPAPPVAQKETPAAPAQAPAVAAQPAADAGKSAPVLAGKVTETMDSGGYTYVQVDSGEGSFWAAAPRVDVKVGDAVAVQNAMPMTDFRSKTLDRSFELLYFASAISVAGSPSPPAAPNGGHAENLPRQPSPEVDLTGIPKAEGGVTVGELFDAKAELAGKPVAVRGRVVKVSAGIMGKNWLHLRDGTGAEGTNDLTVTTQGSANVGDTVLVKGVAAADKDFGHGYKYPLIVEEADVAVE